jgi:DNA-binding FadR family transcriptional regulator
MFARTPSVWPVTKRSSLSSVSRHSLREHAQLLSTMGVLQVPNGSVQYRTTRLAK